jgi:hypothetical protein
MSHISNFKIKDNILFKYYQQDTEKWYGNVISVSPFIIQFDSSKNSELLNRMLYPQGQSIMYINISSCVTKIAW